MKPPYEHEESWHAGLLYISGKPSGYIMRDEFTPEGETGHYAYADDALDRVPDVAAYVAQLFTLVEDGGMLLLSTPLARAEMVEQAALSLRGCYLCERSVLSNRVFTAWRVSRVEQPKDRRGIPEAIIFRNGGGIGDVLHAAAVAEEYTRQGFDVCLMTMDKVKHVFAANSFIKRFVPIPTMPDAELFRFMEFWSRRVRLFVNLDWSIEGFLLKKQHTSEYFWSDAQRRVMCGKSYAANVKDLAGLNEQYRITSYASEAEKEEADTAIEKLYAQPRGALGFIFIQLAGSGDVHKWSPHTAKLVLMLLARTDYAVYLSYTNAHSGLAHKIRKHVADNYGVTDRVVYSPAKRSFACNVEIAKHAACVLGPETGLMVALSHEENVRKVLMVSHSAVTNFADWKNTAFLTGSVPCFPCHRIHSSFQFCRKDEPTGSAACQAVISAAEMFEAVTRIVNIAVEPKKYLGVQLDPLEEKFLVVATSSDAEVMAANIGERVVTVEEGDTKEGLINKLTEERAS